MKLQSINPFTEEIMKEYDYSSTEKIVPELKKLRENKLWPDTPVKERAGALKEISRQLEKEKKASSELISKEMGKPIKDSATEVEKCAWLCDYFAENAEKFMEDEHIDTEFQKSYITLDPLGVILGVMPWNFPFWQVFRFVIPALLVGNRIAVKHASNVPQCALKIEEIISRTVPDNTYRNIFMPGRETGKIIESDFVDAVSITGSTQAGSKVAEVAGRNIKKSVLELGGSDPFIVLKDADIKNASELAVKARFLNTGQSCIAAKRIIVEKEIAGDFVKFFVEEVKKARLGDPLDKNTDIGPIARDDLRKDLHDIVRKTREMGAKIATGGSIKEGKGFFYLPTVLTNVDDRMPALTEETFGPVAPVIVVENDIEAIKIANNSQYGLGASLWTENTERAQELAKKIEAGFVSVNNIVRSDPRLPFGGVKKSGYGRELSHHSLKEFANVKTVIIK